MPAINMDKSLELVNEIILIQSLNNTTRATSTTVVNEKTKGCIISFPISKQASFQGQHFTIGMKWDKLH